MCKTGMYNIRDMRMASLAFSALFFCTFLATVCGQTPVVSTSTITTGEKFSFYCDSSRVTTPTGVGNIYSLTLNRTVTGGNSVQIAQYISYAPAGVITEVKNPPSGRQWNITFTGANNGVNNVASMKIVVDVSDTQCSDAGMYYCQILYYGTSGGNPPPVISPGQNVTASMGLSEFGLTAVPDMETYQADDNVTFTCTAKGPSTGVSFRWELWIEDQNGYLSQQSLPNNAEPVTSPATLLPGNTGCQLYSWVSTLSIQVPSDDSQTYKCIVSYQQQQLSGNKTMAVQTNKPAQPLTGDNSPNVGMIVGIVIGCIAAIVIVVGIILFIRYRKRSQENRSSGKDQHDAPNDTNLHAPPPVFYPSSKPSKGSKEEKDTKTPEESERHDIPHYHKNEINRNQRPYDRNRYEDDYNHEQDASSGRKGRRSRPSDSRPRQDDHHPRDEQHYASTDVSHSADESAEYSDSPLDGNSSKPRAKRRGQVPRKQGKDGPRPLHYAELDLPKKKDGSETSSDAGRRREKPVEYAEIRV
ncbi:hypothetical protein BsWGS_16797 [Bradybaena similaris]